MDLRFVGECREARGASEEQETVGSLNMGDTETRVINSNTGVGEGLGRKGESDGYFWDMSETGEPSGTWMGLGATGGRLIGIGHGSGSGGGG